jgi:hypothetical protein
LINWPSVRKQSARSPHQPAIGSRRRGGNDVSSKRRVIARASRNAPSADRLTRVGATFSDPVLSFDSGSSEQYADVAGDGPVRRARSRTPKSQPSAGSAARRSRPGTARTSRVSVWT